MKGKIQKNEFFREWRKIPDNVDIIPVDVNIDGHEIEAEQCNDSCNLLPLYHFTYSDPARFIFEHGYTRPISGERFSEHVSFSLNKNLYYGGGNVKMKFYPSVCKYLKPMRYYDEEKYGKIVDDIIKKRQTMLSKTREPTDVPINFVIGLIGLMPNQYIYECEWYTERMVPVNPDTLESVTLMIPWHLCSSDKTSRCDNRMIPKYSVISYQKGCNLNAVQKEIGRMRERVKKVGVDFFVDSTFPFIYNYEEENVIVLDDENLNRFALGKKPIISDLSLKKATEMYDSCNYR